MEKTIQDAMAAAGLAPHKAIELTGDGKLIRYRVTGDKGGSLNGWAVLNDGPEPFGAFGSWRTGETHTWRAAASKPLTPAEQAANAQRIKAMRQAQAQAQELVYTEARTKAQKLWGRAHWATNKHPYLERKQVHAYGIKELSNMLVIPARDVHGVMHTLQFISADGTKRFLTGGRKAGCYFAIGKPVDRVLLAEGVSTGSTLHMALGAAVAVCFDCGNMLAVARALRGKFPDLRLIICADNDAHRPDNPGLTHARAAAKAVGGFLAVPEFKPGAQLCPF
jgi:putative DNA primase/helicase